MAFTSMLRRCSATVFSLAIRGAGSPRTFRASISGVLSVERCSIVSEIGQRNFIPFSVFSRGFASGPDDNLIRVLESEIECAEEPKEVDNVPDGFPFKIQDNPGERTITLEGKYQDEIIKVEVDMPTVEDENGDEDDDRDEDDEETADTSSIPLVVSISKGTSGPRLEFGITAFPDEITIDSLSIKHPESEDELAYEGPDFSDLDENLQKAFHKYLEIRGIKPATINFLFEYMANKDNKEYLQWLENIKKFMEK